MMIKENEEAPKIKALLDQPLPADETAKCTRDHPSVPLQAVSDQFGTLLPQAETKECPAETTIPSSLT
ncbi:MAG: hypothetical protein R3D66_04970 [Alphaproteobacteria bacterium]